MAETVTGSDRRVINHEYALYGETRGTWKFQKLGPTGQPILNAQGYPEIIYVNKSEAGTDKPRGLKVRFEIIP